MNYQCQLLLKKLRHLIQMKTCFAPWIKTTNNLKDLVGIELYNYYQYLFTTTKGDHVWQVISLDFE